MLAAGLKTNRLIIIQWFWKQIGAVTVSTPGVKTLDIVRREQGVIKIDRIVLTQGAAPTGTGPAESPR